MPTTYYLRYGRVYHREREPNQPQLIVGRYDVATYCGQQLDKEVVGRVKQANLQALTHLRPCRRCFRK